MSELITAEFSGETDQFSFAYEVLIKIKTNLEVEFSFVFTDGA